MGTLTDAPCPHPWRTLVAMTGSLCMIFLDATVVGVALPTIQVGLDMTTSQSAWVVNAFLVAMASSLALGGRLGDRVGRLATFRVSIIVFIAASLTCGLAGSATVLIAARAVQGLAAGCMQPASTAVVIGAVPADKRGRAMATYFGVALLFLMAGPVIGGALIEAADWRWIFYLNVPVGLAAVLLGLGLGLGRQVPVIRRFDTLGAVLVVCGLPLLILGLEWLGHPPEGAPWIPPVLAGFGGAMTLWCVIHSARCSAPLLDVRLIAARPLLGQVLVLCLVTLVMSSQAVYGAIFLQETLGFSPVQAGLGCLPLLVPVVLIIHVAGRWYDRRGAYLPIVVGMSITTLGLVVEVCGIMAHSYLVLAIGMALVGAGSTLASTPANTDLLCRAPADQRGETSGLVQTMRQFGASIGIMLSVLAISVTMALSAPDAHGHGASIDALVKRANEGDVVALKALRNEHPELGQSVIDARSRGMAAAFSIQAIAAGIALVIGITLARPTRGRGSDQP